MTTPVAPGDWSYTTPALLDGSHSFTARATDTAGNTTTTSAVTATINTGQYEGTPGNDTFSFASEAALSAAALINGGLGSDTIQMLSPTTLTDAAFPHAVSIEMLGLTGASSVTLGALALLDGLGTVNVGTGTTNITDSNSGAL